MKCLAVQINKKRRDFKCNKGEGHTDAHVDPDTETKWKHPNIKGHLMPRGVKFPRKPSNPGNDTKPKVYWMRGDKREQPPRKGRPTPHQLAQGGRGR